MTLNPAPRAYTPEELAKCDLVVVKLSYKWGYAGIETPIYQDKITDFLKKSIEDVVSSILNNYEPEMPGDHELHEQLKFIFSSRDRCTDFVYLVNGWILRYPNHPYAHYSQELPSSQLNDKKFLCAEVENGKIFLSSNITLGREKDVVLAD